jgi:hypothetical protein
MRNFIAEFPMAAASVRAAVVDEGPARAEVQAVNILGAVMNVPEAAGVPPAAAASAAAAGVEDAGGAKRRGEDDDSDY